jgi:hypothetical protein
MKKILLRVVSVILFLVAALMPVLATYAYQNMPPIYEHALCVSGIIIGVSGAMASFIIWASTIG